MHSVGLSLETLTSWKTTRDRALRGGAHVADDEEWTAWNTLVVDLVKLMLWRKLIGQVVVSDNGHNNEVVTFLQEIVSIKTTPRSQIPLLLIHQSLSNNRQM